MIEIQYKINLLSDWHVGSGLDSGADADSLVLKDENKLPFIPGKTIKGLLKDALLEIKDVQPNKCKNIDQIFGKVNKDKSTETGKDKSTETAFFGNADLPKKVADEIVGNGLSDYLYRNISSTKIGKNGVAEKMSLRTMEVTMPVELEGTIHIEDESDKELIEMAMKWLRSVGVKRNRGLGRCQFSLIKNNQQ